MKYRIVKDNHTDCGGKGWYRLQRTESGIDTWHEVDCGYLETMQRRAEQVKNPVRFEVVEEFTV
jgi:hypothetical protein